MNNTAGEYLTEHEARIWDNVWSFSKELPAKIDAELKQSAGISHFDFTALRRISTEGQGSLKLSDLALSAGMSLSHLSRVITRLEKKQLVRRVPDSHDGRSTIAELTESGRRIIEDAGPSHAAEIRRLFFEKLTPEEFGALETATAKIADTLRESPGE